MTTIQPAPVRKAVTVDAPLQKAFAIFTEKFGSWWPASHSIGKSKLRTAVIEPRTGGRWFEVGEDGTECTWGEVLAWEPPTRLVLAWRIGPDWRYDAALLTEVEVRFMAAGDNATRIELEHRLLENMGAAATAARETFESEGGWTGLLAAYGTLVKASN